jgi:cation transport protein ChaC
MGYQLQCLKARRGSGGVLLGAIPDNARMDGGQPMAHPLQASAPARATRAGPVHARTLPALQAQHPAGQDLWVFGYASLIWRPEFEALETHPTRVHGWHRALQMWSRVNRGTPECPGLVFALLRGGSCQGLVYRVQAAQAQQVLERLWAREMPLPVYEPRWLPCPTPGGTVRALAFTLPTGCASHTGKLSPSRYREIFARAEGRFGLTRDYAVQTLQALREHGIEDRALAQLIRLATTLKP